MKMSIKSLFGLTPPRECGIQFIGKEDMASKKSDFLCKPVIPPSQKEFNDLQLQLHATTVTNNPYTLNVTGNITVSASLKNSNVVDESGFLRSDWEGDIIFPPSVKVVQVYTEGYDSGGEITLDSQVINTNTIPHKTWGYGSRGYTYVGVTPGKLYHLQILGEEDNSYGYVSVTSSIAWGGDINNHTPNVTDY